VHVVEVRTGVVDGYGVEKLEEVFEEDPELSVVVFNAILRLCFLYCRVARLALALSCPVFVVFYAASGNHLVVQLLFNKWKLLPSD
jgi:hypothetical protein